MILINPIRIVVDFIVYPMIHNKILMIYDASRTHPVISSVGKCLSKPDTLAVTSYSTGITYLRHIYNLNIHI